MSVIFKLAYSYHTLQYIVLCCLLFLDIIKLFIRSQLMGLLDKLALLLLHRSDDL